MDIKKTISNNLFWVGLWLAQFFLFFFLQRSSRWIDFIQSLFYKTQYFRVRLLKGIPFSVGDVFYLLLVVYIVTSLLLMIRNKTRKKIFRNLLIVLNALYFVYQIQWGTLYFQRPLLDKSQIYAPVKNSDLKILAEKYLEKSKESRANFKDSVFKVRDLRPIIKAIESQQKNRNFTISVKPSLWGGLMSYSGILGYYNPFSSEAQVNQNLPHTYLIFTMAHEASHQIGFAREEEANFSAFIIGQKSENPELRYASNWFALKNILYNLSAQDEGYVRDFINKLPQPLKNDYLVEKDFYNRYSGKVASFFSFTNDLFLKSNQQDGSVSYNYFIYLLLEYEKSSGLTQ